MAPEPCIKIGFQTKRGEKYRKTEQEWGVDPFPCLWFWTYKHWKPAISLPMEPQNEKLHLLGATCLEQKQFLGNSLLCHE